MKSTKQVISLPWTSATLAFVQVCSRKKFFKVCGLNKEQAAATSPPQAASAKGSSTDSFSSEAEQNPTRWKASHRIL